MRNITLVAAGMLALLAALMAWYHVAPSASLIFLPVFAALASRWVFSSTRWACRSRLQIGTLNGARYLGRDKQVGSIAVGKRADLMVVAGNPAAAIADIRKVEIVFKQGVGFDPAKLIASVSGRVGLW